MVNSQLITKLRRRVIGHDIFVAYSRQDGLSYASALVNGLSKLEFECRIDLLGTEPGSNTPESLLNDAKHSMVLVIVGTPAACRSEQIHDEVKIFTQAGCKLIIIELGGNIQEAVWEKTIHGLPIAREVLKEDEAMTPSPQIIEHIQSLYTYQRTSVQRKKVVNSAFILLGASLLIATAAGLIAYDQTKKALAEAKKADDQRKLNDFIVGGRTTNENVSQKILIETLEQALKRDPTYTMWMYVGDLKADLNDHPGAMACYEQAERLIGHATAKTRLAMSTIQIATGLYGDARKSLDVAQAEVEKETGKTTNLRFMIKIDCGLSYLEEGTRMSASDSRRNELFAKAKVQYEAAEQYMDGATPKQLGVWYGNLGKVHFSLNELEKAGKDYENQIAAEEKMLSNSYLVARFNLANYWVNGNGKELEAIDILKSVDRICLSRKDSLASRAELRIGDAYRYLKQTDQARTWYQTAKRTATTPGLEDKFVSDKADERLKLVK